MPGAQKLAEDRAAAARNQAKAELEQSAELARAEAQAHVEKLRASANATEANVSESWNDMQETLNAHIAKVRKNIGEKKGLSVASVVISNLITTRRLGCIRSSPQN